MSILGLSLSHTVPVVRREFVVVAGKIRIAVAGVVERQLRGFAAGSARLLATRSFMIEIRQLVLGYL